MKNKSSTFLILLFLATMLGLIIFTLSQRPRILIIHSYRPESPWVREEEIGIMSQLSKSVEKPHIRRHYLGMDRSWSGRSLEIAKKDAERSVADFKPQILLAMDDEARAFVAQQYAGRNDIAVVFGGVNEHPEHNAFFKEKNVTGILEQLPLEAIDEFLSDLGKGKKMRVALIGDASVSAKAEEHQIFDYKWKTHEISSHTQIQDFDTWQKKIKSTSEEVDVIILTGFEQLRRSSGSTEVVSGREVVEWAEQNSKALLISNDIDFIADGGSFTIACSPQEEGREAAALALEIIAGKKPYELPIRLGKEFYILMSNERISQKGIHLPKVYESAARLSGYSTP